MEISKVSANTILNSYKAGQTKVEGDFAAGQKNAASTGDDAKLKSVCRDMEAVFLNIMLSKMRATVVKSNLLPDQSKEELMQSMLDSEMTKNMAQAGGIGLADMLYRQLTLQGSNATVKKSGT